MNNEITLSDFFSFILSKLKQILILGIVGALLVFAYVKFGTTTTYSFSGSMIVTPFNENVENWTPNMGNSEVSIAKQLMPTYIEVLTSNDLSIKISKYLENQGVNVSASRVRNIVKYSNTDDKFTIDFTCTNASESQAKAVADAVSEIAPSYVRDVVEYGNIKMYDSVSDKPQTHRSNPYVMAMVAFMAIAIAVVVVNLIITMLDNRVKTVEDITDNFEYPVLGNIPNFYFQNKRKEYDKTHGGDR